MAFSRSDPDTESAGRFTRRDFLTGAAATIACAAIGTPLQLPGAALSTSPGQPVVANGRFSSVRGVDYYPSWVRSLPDLWLQYDRDAARFELSLARALGFNSIRVWLGTEPWQKLGAEMWNRVAHFLDLARQMNVSVLPVVFDSCGVEPGDYTGEVVTLREAYRRALADPSTSESSRQRMRLLAGRYVETSGKDAWCPYSKTDPSTILWQWHTPSPGYSLLRPTHWPKWENYLREALTRFGDHPAVLAWDLMNEPNCIRLFTAQENGAPGFDQEVVYSFIAHMREIAAGARPQQPITFGFESATGMREMAGSADVLSFHSYEADPAKLQQLLTGEREFAAAQGKELLLTEAAAVLFIRGTEDTGDAAQLELYRNSFPVLEQAGIGYYAVALMEGRFPFAWVGYCRPDGSRKPVADYIESVLKHRA